MGTIISIVLLAIIIICIWSGYKKGIVMGVGGVLAIIVSLYGANLLANTFSFEILPAMRPFASGYIEGRISDDEDGVMVKMGWSDYGYSATDMLEQHPESRQDFAKECFMAMGLDDKSSEALAGEAVTRSEENDEALISSVVEVLCQRVSFVGCFVIAFLLILIVLTVIGNLPNLSYKIPNLELVNDIGGAALGLITGIMFCAIIVWALKFAGIIIGADTLESSAFTRLFLNHNFLSNIMGF